MQKVRHVIVFALALLLANMALSPSSNAQDTAEATPVAEVEAPLDDSAARLVIGEFHTQLLDIMRRSDELGHDGRAEALYPILNAGMNVKALGVGAVGKRAWGEWSEEQQEQFIESFTRFMYATYAARFNTFNDQQFHLLGTRAGPRGSIIVQTELRHPNNPPTNLTYLMIHRDDRWGIADIFLDGAVSEVAMRRSEYSSVLKAEGFEGLLAAIEENTQNRATP